MIATLKGLIAHIEEDQLIVEVGGVGVQVHVPRTLAAGVQTGESVFLNTFLVVRQDALTLFGFETAEGRSFFKMLLGVNGVGPRLALAILSALNTESIRRAVFNEQVEIFNRVPGVGKKTAQKIMLHLQDRLPSVEGFQGISAISDADSEVLDALTALGYSVIEAQSALQTIPRDAPKDVETRLRLALQYFTS